MMRRGRWLIGQATDGLDHRLGRHTVAVFVNHAGQTQLFGPFGADILFAAWHSAGHDHGGFVKRQDLAKGVVTAHADHALRAGKQVFDLGFKADGLHAAIQFGHPLFKFHTGVAGQERAIDQHGHGRQIGVLLISGQHKVDHRLAIAPAARRDQDIGLRNGQRLIPDFAAQIAGPVHPLAHRLGQVQTFGRVIDGFQPVHPDFIVELFGSLACALALPFHCQRFGGIQNIAQAQNQFGFAVVLQVFQCWQ